MLACVPEGSSRQGRCIQAQPSDMSHLVPIVRTMKSRLQTTTWYAVQWNSWQLQSPHVKATVAFMQPLELNLKVGQCRMHTPPALPPLQTCFMSRVAGNIFRLHHLNLLVLQQIQVILVADAAGLLNLGRW